jgi:hypothetical protein
VSVYTRDGKEVVWVVGCPKSGNTWLTRLVAEALDSPSGDSNKVSLPPSAEGFNRPGKYYVFHEHLMRRRYVPAENKVIFIIRDLRDVIVSAKYYWKIDTIDGGIDKISYRWVKINHYWYNEDRATSYIRYEQLIDNAPYHLGRVLNEIGVAPAKDLNEVVANQEINTKRKYIEKHGHTMPYGLEGQRGMLRKGIVGDWRNHFSKENAKRVHDEFYDMLNSLGYENDPEWWEKVP